VFIDRLVLWKFLHETATHRYACMVCVDYTVFFLFWKIQDLYMKITVGTAAEDLILSICFCSTSDNISKALYLMVFFCLLF
jgi:hypothetical protein